MVVGHVLVIAAVVSSGGVRVERGLARHIREESTQIAIRVSGVPDVMRAIQILDSVRPYIHGLGARFVSEAFPAPGGAMTWLDGKGVAVRQLLTIPEQIAQAFTQAGLHEAVVGTAKGVEDTDPDYPREVPRCVSMSLFAAKPPPMKPAALPEPWVAAGREWWLEQAQERRRWVSLIGSVYPVNLETADQMLQATVASRSGGNAIVAGTPDEGAASLSCAFSLAPSMTLKLGGVSETDLLATANRFVDLARSLAEHVVYGVVEFLPLFTPNLAKHHPVGRELSFRVTVCDSGDYANYVFDAFPFQVLSEGHLRWLPLLPDAEPLAGGRVGLQFGRIEDWLPVANAPVALNHLTPLLWLPETEAVEAQDHGRALLEPCLLKLYARRTRRT